MSEDGKRTAAYGWSRISHEAQIVTYCVALGGVILPPGLPQDQPTKFPSIPPPRRAGFRAHDPHTPLSGEPEESY